MLQEMKNIICSANKHKFIIEDFLKINKIFHNFSKILTMDELGFMIDNSSFSNRVFIKKSLLHNVMKKYTDLITNLQISLNIVKQHR